MSSRRSWFLLRGAALSALLALGGCQCLDLSVPPRPMSGGFEGVIDVQGHIPKADNEVKLARTDGPGTQAVKTDADGKFSFGGLVPGLYMIQADLPGFAPLREGPFQVTPGQTTDLGTFKPVWLSQTPSEGGISGLVIVAGGAVAQDGGVDGGGRPSDAEGATVVFFLERTGGMPARVAEATVNAFGTFSARLPPGTYTLEATHPYYVAARRSGVVLGEGQQLDITAQPLILDINPAQVAGDVVLEVENPQSTAGSSRPGAGAVVTADTGQTTTVDSTGHFVLPGLPAGSRQLRVELQNFHDPSSPRSIQLRAGEQARLPEIRLLLDRGDISGRVRMSDGSQLDGVTVSIEGTVDGGAGAYATTAVRSAAEASVGDFTLRGLPVGTYSVVARRTNYVEARSGALTVALNQTTRLPDELRLARLQGDFTIEDSDPSNTLGYTRERPVTLVLSNVTNAAEFRVAEGSAQALSAATYQPFTSPRIPFTLSAGDELKTVYLQIKNTAGNEGAALSATVVLDTTPPDNATVELASNARFTRIANPIPVTLNATDLGGVAFVRLAAPDADGGVPTTDAGVADGGFPELAAPRIPYVRDTSFTRPSSADGVQDVLAQFIDNAGNASEIVRASIIIDTVAPTGALTIARGSRATVDGYTHQPLVDLNLTYGTEPNGGVLYVRLANDATDLTNAVAQPVRARVSWFLDAQGEGTKTVHYQFVDGAGNASSAAQATIIFDATPPVVTATLLSATPTADAGITIGLSTVETAPYSPDAGLAVSESAIFSNAVVQPYPSNNQVDFRLSTGDGRKTVYVRVRDAAGNDGTSSVQVDLDTTPPSGLSLSLAGALADGTPSSSLTAANTVTVNVGHVGATRLLLSDESMTTCPALGPTWRVLSSSAIANHPLPGSGDGRRTVTACFSDEAGNVAGPVSASIDYDGTAPSGCQLQLSGVRSDGLADAGVPAGKTGQRTVPYALSGCSEVSDGGVLAVEIALTEAPNLTCSPNAAGLVWGPYNAANQVTLSSIDGLKTVRGCVRDAARNTQAFGSAGLVLDTTPPANPRVVINGGAAYINAAQADGGAPTVTVTGTAVGASEWAIAEDTSPTDYVDYATQNPRALTLSGGDGVKLVKALFRDDVGNSTPVEAQDTIEVDTTAPTLSSVRLVGALADGVASSSTTTQAEVTAELVQTGATTLYLGDSSLTACPATSGHQPLVGNSARVTLTGTGTTRTVKVCVGDAAGNVSSLATASIDFDGTGPSGCALVLTGVRADDLQPTTGGAAGKTGRRDVRYALTSCTETPAEIVLTESTVSCAANASLSWTLYNAAATNTFTLGGLDGSKTVRGCVRDAAHNTSAVVAATLTLDTTPPSGASVVIDTGAAYVNAAQKASRGGVNQASVAATVTGATEWALAENATPSSFQALAGSNPSNFAFSAGDGVKTVRALFKDDVGNASVSEATDSIEFDTAAPTLTSVLVTGTLADGTSSEARTSTTSVLATVVQSGASGIAFGDASLTSCASAAFTSYSGGTVQATLTGSGSPLTLAVCVTDAAGNTAGPVTDTIAYDSASPSGCVLVMAGKRADGTAAATALDKTALRDLTYTLSGCTETPTELFLTEATTVSCTATANFDWRAHTGTGDLTLSPVDGVKTLRGCVRDAAHNVASLGVDSITLDATAPSGASVALHGGAAFFNNADFVANNPDSNAMAVTGTATGASEWALAEGAAPSTYVAFTGPSTTSTFAISAGDGLKTIRALFRDDVGNTTPLEVSDTITVDTALPTLTAATLVGTLADGTPSGSFTTNTTVTVSLTQNGATLAQLVDSTVSTCPATGYTSFAGTSVALPLPGSGAVRTAKACVADAAGNTAGPLAAGSMTVDSSAPAGCALLLTGRRVDGSNTSGATVDKSALRDVTASLTGCAEAPTEIFLTEASSVTCTPATTLAWVSIPSGSTGYTLSAVDALKTVRGCVRDAAHNVTSFVADSITLDMTPPTAASLVLKSGAAYFNRADYLGNLPNSNAMAVTGTAAGATEWALAEGAVPSSFTAFTSPSTTSTFAVSAGDGTKTLRALFRDDVGNTTPLEATDSIDVDTNPPTLTSLTLIGTLADGTSSTALTAVTTVTASLVHVDGVQAFFGDSTVTACPASGYAPLSGNLAQVTLTGTGTTRTVKACVMDVAGNTAGVATDTIDVDSTAPGGCSLTLNGRRFDGSATSGATVDRTAQRDITATVNGCVDAVEISLTEAATVNCSAATLTWLPIASGSVPVTLSAVDGLKTVRGCVRDATLNASTISQDTITLDTTPPTGIAVSIKGGAAYFNQTDFLANLPNSNAMPVTGTATGATEWALAEGAVPSAWAAFASSPTTSSFTFSAGQGTRTIRALFRDDVGNVSVVEATDSIDVDLTPPTVSGLLLTGLLADGTSSTQVTTQAAVEAALTHSGGTQVLFGDGTLSSCATTGYVPLTGASMPVTLTGTGTTRTVKACIADAAGNTAGPVLDTIDLDSTTPGGCALVLVGKKVDGTATGGATANRTALQDVTATLTGCSETPVEIFLTEAGSVTCTPSAALTWAGLPGTGAPMTLSSVDGTKTVRGCVRDAARNVASFTADAIDLDTTPPTGVALSLKSGAAYFNNADFVANTPDSNSMPATGTATGASEWALAEGATPSTFVAFSGPSSTTTFAISAGDGTKTLRALFRDDVGNTSAEVQDSIDVDTGVPTLTSILLTGTLADGTESTVSTVSTTVKVGLVQSGATLIAYGDSALTTCPSSGYTTFSGTETTTTLPGTGTPGTLKVCVADAAGNTAGPAVDTISIDTSAPTGCQLLLTGRKVNGTATGGATVDRTAVRDVGVSLTGCNEAPTEIYLTEGTATCTAVNNFTWVPLTASTVFTLSPGEASKTVRGCVRDASNNTLSFTQDSITLDETPPTAATVTIKGGAAYFNATDFAAAGNANTMSVAGAANGATEWAIAEAATPTNFTAFPATSPSNLTFSVGQGTKTVLALFKDDVGNVTAVEATDSITVDTTPPTLTSINLTGTLADGNPSDVTTITTQVTLTLVHQDGVGLYYADGTLAACPTAGYASFAGTTATITLPGSGASRTVRACVADVAGNVAGYQQDTIGVDSVAPSGCALTLVGRRTDGAATTGGTANKSAQAVVGATLGSCSETPTEIFLTEASSVTCTPAASLTWEAYVPGANNFTLTGGDGTKTVIGCVRDAAHNVSNFTLDTIALDTTPPTGAAVSLFGGAAYFNLAAFNANLPPSNRMALTGTATGATEWAFAEGALPSSWQAFSASPTTVQFDVSAGEGTRTLRALFRDDVGNTIATEATDSIDVDLTNPTLTGITLTGALADGTASTTTTATTTVLLSLAHTDGTKFYFADGTLAACPTTIASYNSFTGASASISLPGSGATRTVRACVADVAGNIAGFQQATIGYDPTAPTGCALTLVGKRTDGSSTAATVPEKTALTTVTASLSACSETVSDIYLVESSAAVTCPVAGSPLWQTLSGGTTFAFTLSSGDVLKTVKACVRDAARNVSAASFQDTITLDTTPPSSATLSLHGGAAYFNRAAYVAAGSANTMNLTASATGATEWVYAEAVAPNPAGFVAFSSPTTISVGLSTGDGTKTVRALFRDDVGNVTPAEAVDTIEVDTVNPTLTSVALTGTLADGTSSSALTTTSSVQLSLVHTDGARLYYSDGSLAACPTTPASYSAFAGNTASITLPAGGTVRACITDLAGNVAGYQQAALTLDATPPTGCGLTLVGKRTDGSSSAATAPEKSALTGLTASLTGCSETPQDIYLVETTGAVTCPAAGSALWQSLSGGTTLAFSVSGGDALKTVKACVRDAARNVSASSFVDTITLDTTPPTGAALSLHGGAAYFNRAAFLSAGGNTMNLNAVATGATEWVYAENAAPNPAGFVAFSSPTNLSVTLTAGDGTKTVRALFRDDVGNATPAEAVDTIEVDTANPTLTSITLTGSLADGSSSTTTTTSTAVQLGLVHTDGARLYFSDGTLAACPTTFASYSAFAGNTASITLPASGVVRACIVDLAGNVAGYQQASLTLDSTAPSSCTLTLVGRRTDGSSTAATAPDKTALTAVTATLSTCSETPVDVYLIETAGAVSCPAAGSPLWQTLSGGLSLGFTLTGGDALKTVKGCVRDAARNVSASAFQDGITLDTTPPSAASISLHTGQAYFNLAAYNGNVPPSNRMNVTGTATGATEWVFAENAPPNPAGFGAFTSPTTVAFTFSAGDGTKLVRALFRDDVGNVTPAEANDTIEVDTVAPVFSSMTLQGTLGDGTSSTLITNVLGVTANFVQFGGTLYAYGDTATFSCPATLASFASFSGSAAPVTLPGSSSPQAVTACLADLAGNFSVNRTDTIQVDTATPTGCALVMTGKKVDGSNTTGPLLDQTALRDVGVSLSGCADTNVQLALTEAPTITCNNSAALTWFSLSAASTFQVTSGDGTKTVRGCVRDQALNVGTLAVDNIDLDQAPPDDTTVSIANVNGFITTASPSTVTVSGYATGASEWATANSAAGPWVYSTFSTSPSTKSLAFATPDGTKFLYARFRDALQNVSPVVSTSVILDTTAPIAPVLLTVDGQNRSARLFWDPATDLNGIARYELMCGASTPSTVCATVAGTATDGYVLNLGNKIDQVFAVRAVDNAGLTSVLSGTQSTTTGWRRSTVNPGAVQPVRPLDIAIHGPDVYVTYMEIDYNWAGLGGSLKVAVSHDRGQNWEFRTLDGTFAPNRTVAPIAFTDQAVWVASAGNDGATAELTAGPVQIWSSTDRGDTWTNVSAAALSTDTNFGKTDSLGVIGAGSALRVFYMLANGSSTKHINLVWSASNPAVTGLQSTYDVTGVFGGAPYQALNGIKACAGNYSSLVMWKDRNGAGIETNLRGIIHYQAPSLTFNSANGEGYVEAVTFGAGAGREVGAFDVACVSLPETMEAYTVFNRAPAAAWAVGTSGTMLRWDDTSWATASSPTTKTIYSVQDVWAVGAGYTQGATNYDTILRWNGSTWEEMLIEPFLLPSTIASGNSLLDIWSSSTNNVYAVGNAGTIIRWDGTAWTLVAHGLSLSSTSLTGIWGSSSANIWITGSGNTLVRYTGAWSTVAAPGTSVTLRAIWGASSSDIWAVGDSGRIIHYNGSVWSVVASPTANSLYSVWGTASNNIWAVGAGGVILKYNGSTWATFASPTSASLQEVAGVSSGEVWAVGSGGTAIKFDGVSWTVVPTATTSTLYSVWGGTSGGGSPNNVYQAFKSSSLTTFGAATTLRSDGDPTQAPQVWAGSRNVYVLYRDTSNRLMLGESTNEGASYPNWTTLQSGAGRGLFGVLSGENSSDVAVAFTDVNAAAFTVMLPALPSFPLTVTAGITTSTLNWTSVAGVDRYQIDSDPDGLTPWTSVDFTSTTQSTVPQPSALTLASYYQVESVDSRGMSGNTGELWQVRPFNDVSLVASVNAAGASNTGGIVAYNNKVAVWPPYGTLSGNEMVVYQSTDYGQTWTSYAPLIASTAATRALAGAGGRMVMFYEDQSVANTLKALRFGDISTTATLANLHVGVPIDLIAAKASNDNTQLVVAYADITNDLIRVGTMDSTFTFTLRANIATLAANTIGAIEVAKADFSQGAAAGRIVITWREYSAGDPRNDYIRAVESTNSGGSWGSTYTLASGQSSPNNGGAFTDYSIGNTYLSGSNNGAYSVLARSTEYNDFWRKPANLWLTVTGTDHNTVVNGYTYTSYALETETVDSMAMDAFANQDGHYLAYRTESLDGTLAKLKLAYCVSDCHLVSHWSKSLLKAWQTNVKLQARVVDMTVAQTSSSVYDPAVYVLYQDSNGSSRTLRVLSRGVERRTK